MARSVSDEAISAENKDCFAPFAMTLWLNLMLLHRGPVTDAAEAARIRLGRSR